MVNGINLSLRRPADEFDMPKPLLVAALGADSVGAVKSATSTTAQGLALSGRSVAPISQVMALPVSGGLFILQGTLVTYVAGKFLTDRIPEYREAVKLEGIHSERAVVAGGKLADSSFLFLIGLSLMAFGISACLLFVHPNISAIRSSYWMTGGIIGALCVARGISLFQSTRYSKGFLRDFEGSLLDSSTQKLREKRHYSPRTVKDAERRDAQTEKAQWEEVRDCNNTLIEKKRQGPCKHLLETWRYTSEVYVYQICDEKTKAVIEESFYDPQKGHLIVEIQYSPSNEGKVREYRSYDIETGCLHGESLFDLEDGSLVEELKLQKEPDPSMQRGYERQGDYTRVLSQQKPHPCERDWIESFRVVQRFYGGEEGGENESGKLWLERRIGHEGAKVVLEEFAYAPSEERDRAIRRAAIRGLAGEKLKADILQGVAILMILGGVLAVLSSPFVSKWARTINTILLPCAIAANGIFIGMELGWLPVDSPAFFKKLQQRRYNQLYRSLTGRKLVKKQIV